MSSILAIFYLVIKSLRVSYLHSLETSTLLFGESKTSDEVTYIFLNIWITFMFIVLVILMHNTLNKK